MGMHRTGSSLTARVFHEFGFYLTDTPGVPDTANPEGEYENLTITGLNKNLLHESGGSWYDPVEVKSYDTRTAILIDEYKKDLWGWKDNRTAFTFKAWEPFLQDQSIMFVVTHRDKKAVINSLMRTHKMQFPEDKRNPKYMGALYDRYYNQIDKVTKGYNRIDVHFEDMVKNKFFNPDLKHF